jgi:putative ABC transport system permease protein
MKAMNLLWQDVRIAARALRGCPGTCAVAVVTLGLGIGALTAAFSWTRALLLRPYVFDDLDRLVTVWEHQVQPERSPGHEGRSASGDRNPLAPADFLDLSRESRSFSRLSAYRYRDFNLTGRGDPERVQGVQVTPGFFETLGIGATLGRVFLPEEGEPGRDRVVAISDGFWRRRLAADANVLGREVTLNDRAYTVVGVLPSGFAYPLGGVDLWAPLAFTEDLADERHALSLRVLGRLAESANLDEARAEMGALAARLARAHPRTNAGRGVTLVPLREQQIGVVRPFLLVFHAASLFVLLIACANVGSLLLARAATRRRDMAIRSALGASRSHVVRLILAESALLSLLGAGVALLLARTGVDAIRASLAPDIVKWIPGWQAIRVEGVTLGFCLLATLVTALVAGLAPALQALRDDLTRALTEGGRGSTPGRRPLRRLVVVSELALALVLATGATLMVQGFTRLTNLYRGLDPAGVLTLSLRLPEWRYREPHEYATFYQRLLDQLHTIPGLESAAVASQIPADLGPTPGGGFTIEGRPAATAQEVPFADQQTVSGEYFQSLRISLLEGRLLGEQDRLETPGVVLASESLAGRFWPGGDAVGRRLKLGAPEAPNRWLTVVGVVADVKQYWFDREPRPTLYLPYLQAPRRNMNLVLRTARRPEELTVHVRDRIRRLDPAQPVDEVRTMERVVAESTAFIRTAAALLATLAALACMLGAVGVYGLMSHHVAQRRNEIGVRIALGASRREVLTLVLRQAFTLAGIGVAVGVPASLALGRLLSSVLYGVVSSDPASLAAITALLAAVALFGGYVPARRAAALDPTVALREG